MELDFTVRITLNGRELDARLAALLAELRTRGSLAAAARSVGCSYRSAWDSLRAAQVEYGEPLVHLARGRGARLSEFGEQLIAAQTRARAETRRTLSHVARDAQTQLRKPRKSAEPRISIVASHDLGLIELRDFCARATPPLAFDLRFRGSLDALSELARARCDLAGFHVGPEAQAESALLGVLSARLHRLIVLANRRQGLMVAPGNPKRIKRLSDLTRRGMRFVNRQPGSGTRILFDSLLAGSGTSAKAIRGYTTEEFTHLAVAATVASHHADAAFGIEAAAARYGLDFLPLTRETYYLAARRADLGQSRMRLLVRNMTSPAWRRLFARLQGYDASACGTVVEVPQALTYPPT